MILPPKKKHKYEKRINGARKFKLFSKFLRFLNFFRHKHKHIRVFIVRVRNRRFFESEYSSKLGEEYKYKKI